MLQSVAGAKFDACHLVHTRTDAAQQADLLHAAGIGCHVHHSTDGGKSFRDITDEVYGKEGLQGCKGGHTPVPYFMQEGALLGSDTGDIIACKDVSHGGWRKLCEVPGHITTITVKDRSPSSVTH